jgi:hypothetical protein
MDISPTMDILTTPTTFTTDLLLKNSILERAFYNIIPETGRWTFDNLFIFINQLPDSFEQCDRARKSGPLLSLPLSYKEENSKFNLIFYIDVARCVIEEVKCHREILIRFFQNDTADLPTEFGSRNRKLTSPNSERSFVNFFLPVTHRERSTRYLLTFEKNLLLKQSDFQPSIKKDAAILFKEVKRNDLTEAIFSIQTMFLPIFRKERISCLEELKEKIGGIFHLFNIDDIDFVNFENTILRVGLEFIVILKFHLD